MEKRSFKNWFGIGALMFGTYCGANMASGAYAAGYIVSVGGGWALVWLAAFLAFMIFFGFLGLNFVRAYQVRNYHDYYVTLWGLHKPNANRILKGVVSVFFDVYLLVSGLVIVAGTLALFATLMSSLLHIPAFLCSLGGVALFAVLTVNGAGFLRKFNTIMTFALLACLFGLLFAVIAQRGDVLAERLGNFQIGTDWNGGGVRAHLPMFIAYCFSTSGWGSTMSNYAEKITTRRDAVGSGITVGILVTSLFALTGLIVLPYMPEVVCDAPIMKICQDYLPAAFTAVYWVVVIFSVVTTAPTFTYNMANRWSLAWKSEKVSRKAKILVISVAYLLIAWVISGVGLMTIVTKAYAALGEIALFAIAIPLLVSIFRVWRKDHPKTASSVGESGV